MTHKHVIIRLGPSDSVQTYKPTEKEDSNTLSVSVPTKESLATCLVAEKKGLLSLALESMELVILSNDLASHLDAMALSTLVPSLVTDGECRVVLLSSSTESTKANNNVDVSLVKNAFLLAGLTMDGERREEDGTLVLLGRKKAVAGGGSQQGKRINISLSEEKKEFDTKGSSSAGIKKVMLANLDCGDGGDDLIDEDQLLDDDVLAPPPAMDPNARKAAEDDCGGRKACENCTCGRAEQEVADQKAGQQVSTPSCGNCYKGDAFRCASCPYLGKPAFKPGEEHLVLDLKDDF